MCTCNLICINHTLFILITVVCLIVNHKQTLFYGNQEIKKSKLALKLRNASSAVKYSVFWTMQSTNCCSCDCMLKK